MKPLLLLLLSVLGSIPALASPATPDSEPGGFAEWKLVTKQNFSSQIRHHPHILLLVTLPWSGESRSLMKEIAHSLHKRKEEFGSLRLMFMYKNVEKMLADAIGASQETAIMYYHHSTSYKYRGRLRAQNILSSLCPYLKVPPENLPLKLINFEQDLKSFLESTDRALLLLEFCGWAPELLSRGRKNGTEHGYGSQGDIVQVHDKMDRMSTFIGNKKQKSLENGVAQCGIQNGFYGIPSFGELSSVNDSSTTDSTEDERHGAGVSCNFREFQKFESFFSKFMTAAREFLLPPERHRFGLITNRSLLLSLGVGEIDSWSAMIHYAGCPSCSKYLEKEEDFERFLQMEDPAVAELEDNERNERNLEPALPANKPSILLFVDRSSDSSETRIKSKEALDAFRELALRYHIPAHMSEENKEELGKFSAHSHLSSRSMHRHPKASGSISHPKLKLYQSAQSVKLGDRVSFVLVNEEKHVTLDKIATDVQVSSLHEVLENLLQKNKAAKLSSLAKKAGFQLLSDDFEIKIASPLSSQTEIQPNQASVELSKEDLVSQIDRDQEKVMDIMSTSGVGLGENINPTGTEPLHYDEEKRDTASLNDDLTSAESEQIFTNTELDNLEDIEVDETHLSKVDELREQLQPRGLEGSFFFLDGNYRLLKALTGGLKVPSLVIIDPILQCHYLFSDQMNFSYTPLAIFLKGYLNGSLLPYQQSESLILMPREAAHPPFVNLDFHEADSIPQIAAKTFYELVFGFNHSEIGNVAPARRKDMLVLFSNGWCGFCQRMELVVREVHRALRGNMNMLSRGFQNAQAQFSSGTASYMEDNMEDMAQKLPLVYLMDCTMNDCSLIFKAMNQRELYPALVLFPAENKTSVSYDGDMAVASVVEFLADYGSHCHNLIKEKGILWTPPAKHGMGQKPFSTTSNVVHEESLAGKDQLQDFLLQNKAADRTVEYSWTELPKSDDPDGAASRVVVGSILVANEKLLGMHPFDNSLILIVKANQVTGFQGLIINKPISWDFLHELEEGSEFLKEAPLSLGGPLVNRGLPLVSFTRVDKNQYLEILPGMRFIDQLETIREIDELRAGNGSVTDYWFFLGHASWGWDQLFDEIDKGAWNIEEDAMKEFTWPRP